MLSFVQKAEIFSFSFKKPFLATYRICHIGLQFEYWLGMACLIVFEQICIVGHIFCPLKRILTSQKPVQIVDHEDDI